MNIFFFGSYLENNNNTLFNSQACGKKSFLLVIYNTQKRRLTSSL